MDYIIDQLPGNASMADELRKDADFLKRYQTRRIVFSYAKEDWPFVEQVAQALSIYFPQMDAFTVDAGTQKRRLPNAFCYTTEGKPFEWVDHPNGQADQAHAEMNDEWAAKCYRQILSQADVFVLFSYKNLIKSGPQDEPGAGRWQTGELHAWVQTNPSGRDRIQFLVDFQRAHEDLDRRAPDWESLLGSTLGDGAWTESGQSVPVSVDAYDLSSARRVAEQILRSLLFGQSPSEALPTETIFSYEKRIVQMYQEIPGIIGAWHTDPDDDEKKGRVLKLLAYVKQGVPAFWPCVARQSDFVQTKENVLVSDDQSRSHVSTIGSPRVGLDMLWPTDFPGRAEATARRPPDMVVAAALSRYHRKVDCRACMLDDGLAFPEAGPRQSIYSTPPQKVAIVVSGGIAPGINAVIDGIVRRQKKYSKNTVVIGIDHGFFGLEQWNAAFARELDAEQTASLVTEGGSCLNTCRLKGLLPSDPERSGKIGKIVGNLSDQDIKILYVIGGDGTMRAAHHLAQACRQQRGNISVVGIPKTMDNDILWVWQSFGFATAVEKARETIDHLATEVAANPRICVLQLFGSASGFVVSHAVLASRAGTCDFALIPEAEFSIDALAWRLAVKVASEKRIIPYGLVVMAESAIPIPRECKAYRDEVGLTAKEHEALDDYLKYRHENHGRFRDGQVSNELRSAGLKLVSEGLRLRTIKIFNDEKLRNRLGKEVAGRLQGLGLPQILVDDEERFRVFTNEPRHLLRSVPPSFSDVIMGNRLGALAVDNAMAGYTGFMISQWLTEFVMVPLDLVALGRKHIPQHGIFWKSVLAKTGQGNLIKQ